ncbi:MAG: PIN domain-containing protein, partial [Proteobacteria bacterium]|nr:PIN domain-containing protein [Pseudomonadota bacterium]
MTEPSSQAPLPPTLVLDTNTVLALWMFRDPALEALRAWIDAGSCRLVSRADALEELRRVLAYAQF